MTEDTLKTTITIAAPAEAVFAVLTDPASHPAIDGTGWVSKALDTAPLTGSGQIFRMGMYHANHPDGTYEVANLVTTSKPLPGNLLGTGPGRRGAMKSHRQAAGSGAMTWPPASTSSTEVTLTYDWSAVPSSVREYITFPPFLVDHQPAASPGRSRHPAVAGFSCSRRRGRT